MRGRDEIVLTSPGAAGPRRAVLRVPGGRDVLVLAGSANGTVVAEIGAHDRTRRLNVRPGRYFIRERGQRNLLEGTLTVAAGDDHEVADNELEAVDYARLAKKGAEPRHDGIEAGFTMRTPLVDGGGLCTGAIAGYVIDLGWVRVTPRVAACRERAANAFVSAATDEFSGDVRVAHAWELGPVTLAAQAQLGGAMLHQSFDTAGTAPPRMTGALAFGGGGQAAIEVMRGVSARVAAEADSYVMRRDDAMATRWETTLALRAVFALGVAF
jgi:hypothetical protein